MTASANPYWVQLAEKLGRKEFLGSPLRIIDDLGDTVLAINKTAAVAGGLLVGAFGTVFVVVGVVIASKGGVVSLDAVPGGLFALIGGVVAGVGFAIAISGALSSRQLRLPMRSRELVLRTGRDGQELMFPVADLQVRLERSGEKAPSSAGPGDIIKAVVSQASGKYRLELVHRSAPDLPILLAKAGKRDKLALGIRTAWQGARLGRR